jgi:hypothetical protein
MCSKIPAGAGVNRIELALASCTDWVVVDKIRRVWPAPVGQGQANWIECDLLICSNASIVLEGSVQEEPPSIAVEG